MIFRLMMMLIAGVALYYGSEWYASYNDVYGHLRQPVFILVAVMWGVTRVLRDARPK